MPLYAAEIPAQPVWGIVVGLALIALMVLVLPFKVKLVEHNLELFFLVMGIAAVTVSGRWSLDLVIEAIKSPVVIGSLPIGIFQVVLVFGLLIHIFYLQFSRGVLYLANKLSMRSFIFILILVLGVVSSIISVIVTSVILAEIAGALPFKREDRIKLVVLACFAVGIGAVLTPLGEPLSTILVQKLSGEPYHAGFTFPVAHFAIYVVPGVIAASVFGAIWIGRKSGASTPAQLPEYGETFLTVIMRAVKVFAFVAALTLLGDGFTVLIKWFFIGIPAYALYWINIISVVLDNATLTAIEISSDMAIAQIVAVIMGLLIAGVMLIPGNIPNIVAAARLKISMREWALLGLPIGLVMMLVYFIALLPRFFSL